MGLIVSLLVSVFAPDLGPSACAALLDIVPQDANFARCGDCDFSIGGLISVDVSASTTCTLTIGDNECAAEVTGGGDAFGFAFGSGTGDIDVNADCEVDGFGSFDAEIGGAFSIGGDINIGACDIELDLDGSDEPIVSCECMTDSCENSEIKASCKQGGDVLVTTDCVNVLQIIEAIREEVGGAAAASAQLGL